MILVTGAAGFIGSNLCYHLVNDLGYDVIGIDKISSESNELWLEELKISQADHFVFQKLDLCNAEKVKILFEQFPINKIVHLAAESHVDRSIDDASSFWKSNVIGTFNLFNTACNYSIESIINQLTDECYGEKPEGEAFEGDQFFPTSPYPCSKTSQYYVGKSFYITFGLPVISTFPVNCFGPRQYHEKIIPKFIHKLLVENKPVPLMQSVHFQRDWLPVIDMCEAHSILLQKGIPGQDYNVGANNHRTNEELTKEILSLCNKDPNLFIEIVPDRKAHDCRYAVNADKLKSLGWQVNNEFSSYLEYTVDWYKTLWKNKL